MNKLIKWIAFLIVIIIISGCTPTGKITKEPIKIGIITDLSGPAAYWGDSTRAGIEIAQKELLSEGYNVEIIFEDYKLESKLAANAAHKLINIDKVDAIYSEFAPGAIPVSAILKNHDLLYIYEAAVASPLEDSSKHFKTYLDYKEGCKQIAKKFKKDGIKKIATLKVTLEFGDLCEQGIREVYNDVLVEKYNLGDQDFKTQMLKLKFAGAEAVINTGFEGDTLNTLKVIKEQNLNMVFGTVGDTMTEQVIDLYSDEIVGGYAFNFRSITQEFQEKLPSSIASDYGAAIGYTHILQMAKALVDCNREIECVHDKIKTAKPNPTIGFIGFNNRIAEFEMEIIRY
jgi:ABC-type branched-subunit amino acid transport system substrate-binding protein